MTLKSPELNTKRALPLGELLANDTWKTRTNGDVHVVIAAFKIIKNIKAELDQDAIFQVTQAFEALRMITRICSDLPLEDYMIYEILSGNDDLFQLMPKPIQADSKVYWKLYLTIEAMIKGNILAHRMSISGSGKVAGGNYAYSGSKGKRMIAQMQQSVHAFFANNPQVLSAIAHFQLPPTFLSGVIAELQSVSFALDEDCEQRIEKNEPVYMLVQTQSLERHVIAVGLGKDYCLVADRGNLKLNGIRVFAGSTNEEARKHIVKTLLDSAVIRTYSDVISILSNHYNITEHVDYYPLPRQTGRNCTWLGAKMMVFIAFYFRAMAVQLSTDLRKAGKLALQCTQLWSDEDKLTTLQHYLNYYTTAPMCDFGPDKLLLAKIYLMTKDESPNQKQIRALLESSDCLTPEVLREGYTSLLEDVQANLVMAFKLRESLNLPSRGQSVPHDGALSTLIADLYITSPKREFEETLEHILFSDQAHSSLPSIKKKCLWFPSQGIEPLIKKMQQIKLKGCKHQ